MLILSYIVFFFKQKTAYEMRISDWSSDVCSSDLLVIRSYSKEGLMATQVRETAQQDALAGWSLPAWTYRDPEFFALELDRVFRPKIGSASCRERVCPYV